MTISGTPAVILRYHHEQDREQFEDLFGRDFTIHPFRSDQAAVAYLSQTSDSDMATSAGNLTAIFVLSHHPDDYRESALWAAARDQHPHLLKILLGEAIELDLLVSLLDQQLIDRCFEQPANPDLVRSHVLTAALTHRDAPHTRANEPVSGERKPAVLIVDDEPAATKYLSRQLELMQDDFRVICARSAEEALRCVQEEAGAVAVVMTDQRMPGMHGKELLSELKQSHPTIVRILTSAWGEVDVALGAVNEGQIFRYRQKPWQAQELLSLFRKALVHHRHLVAQRDHSRTHADQQFAELRQQRYGRLLTRLSNLNERTIRRSDIAAFLDLLLTIHTLPANRSHLRASRETTLEQQLEQDFGQLVHQQLEALEPGGLRHFTRQDIESSLAAATDNEPGSTPTANTPLARLCQSLATLLAASGLHTSQIRVSHRGNTLAITTDSPLRMYSHLLAPLTRISRPLLDQQCALFMVYASIPLLGGHIEASGGEQSFRLALNFPTRHPAA